MATRLNPYLHFDGTAREAMEFYQSVLGGELSTSRYADFGAAEGEAGERLMHAMLETPDGLTLMAADAPAGSDFTPPAAFGVSLSGDDAEKLRGWWARLSEGAEIQVPFEKQAWGDEFGQCVDRFGVPWLVNVAG
ncbi:MAG TPA: VOC family protein [Nocardioidaceae bacterium]|nr:VOC family protein [Nocardioidaceae bacterium]